MKVKMKTMDSIPPNSNPFDHDFYNMGTTIGKDLIMMYGNHPDQSMPYFILVDTVSGKRLRFNIETDRLSREEETSAALDIVLNR